LLGLLRPCFVRVEPWLQAGKYASALMSDLSGRNGWTLAERAGDRTPDRMQRLLNRAVWDTFAAMAVVRRFAVTGLDEAARRAGRRGLAVGAVDETGQVKQGEHTAGVKRHYLGCAGKVANGITTVHLAYVRENTGHALIAARQWIPREQAGDPAKQKIMGLPGDLVFRTKGQLAIDLLTEAFADGIGLDFVCGDEVYGSCTELRGYLEARGQGYVLRVPSNFHLTLARGVKLSCKQAAARLLLASARGWEVRSAGKGSKGARWYGWAWLATTSPRHYLLIRRHRITGELAFHYCHVPEGQPLSLSRLIRAAGLRWPAEESFEFGKGCFGLDQSQVRLYTAIARAHRAGDGRPGDLCRHCRASAPPHRHPGSRPDPAGPAPAHRPRDDPAHRPRNRAAAHPPAPARRRRALAGLAAPTPSPLSLAPPAHTARPQRRDLPGQPVNGCCRTRKFHTARLLTGTGRVVADVRWRWGGAGEGAGASPISCL
jgi:DDE superfamily endonuclease